MRVRGLFRLVLALLALGGVLAGPAAAARVMATPALTAALPGAPGMPCHEAADGAGLRTAPSDAGTTRLAPTHLCCVLTQTVATPLAALVLPVPDAKAARPARPVGMTREGRFPPIPVPPPRFL